MRAEPDPVAAMRCGYVSLVGRANVGKSTLLNRLVGHKLAPTADKPQTTRHRLQGIMTRDDVQMIFVDTPGVHFGHNRLLNKTLNRSAAAALSGVDVLVLVTEYPHWGAEEEYVLKLTAGSSTPLVLCINKLDAIKDKQQLLPYMSLLGHKSSSDEIIPVSAHTGENIPALITLLAHYLPESPLLFPADTLTDKDERFVIAELIREQLTRQLHDEVPYAVYVEVDSLEQTARGISVAATIWVERSAQKGIVIGSEGGKLKTIGREARKSITQFMGESTDLNLWVKVRPGWQDNPRILASMGIDAG